MLQQERKGGLPVLQQEKKGGLPVLQQEKGAKAACDTTKKERPGRLEYCGKETHRAFVHFGKLVDSSCGGRYYRGEHAAELRINRSAGIRACEGRRRGNYKYEKENMGKCDAV